MNEFVKLLGVLTDSDTLGGLMQNIDVVGIQNDCECVLAINIQNVKLAPLVSSRLIRLSNDFLFSVSALSYLSS